MIEGRFEGWAPDALAVYAELEADNTKAFWEANRARWSSSVRDPFDRLAAEVGDRYGPLRVFRPHRDVRFAKDKTPYKTNQGAVTEGEGGESYYLHIDADGLLAASGYPVMERDQLDRYRRAVDGGAGDDLADVLAELPRWAEVGAVAAPLKRAPRGYPVDHPRIELLRHKGLMISRHHGSGPWLSTRRALARITDVWDAAAELNGWLAAHVGPSTEPPPDAR